MLSLVRFTLTSSAGDEAAKSESSSDGLHSDCEWFIEQVQQRLSASAFVPGRYGQCSLFNRVGVYAMSGKALGSMYMPFL